MTTAMAYPPIFYDLQRDGMKIIETRGLWELEGGFMGGPFISHSVFDSTRNSLDSCTNNSLRSLVAVVITGIEVDKYSPNFVGNPPVDCKLLGRANASSFELVSKFGISSLFTRP